MSLIEQAMTRHQDICSSTRTGHLSREHEHELFKRDIQIAADGSKLLDCDEVYLLDAPFPIRIDRIDYFSNLKGNSPMAKLRNEAESCCLARDMISRGWRGNTVKRITVLQRMCRNRHEMS